MTFPVQSLTRRGLIKAAGASLLLPFLPSLAWADDPSAPMPKPPKRWLTILFGNGVYDADWWAKGQGMTMELSPSLKPLEAMRGHFSVIDSLRLFDKTLNEGPHIPYFTNFLSGAHVGNGSVLAQSCDQLLARTIGAECFIPSFNLGAEQLPYGLQGGSSAIQTGTISWSSPVDPVPTIFSPRDAFDELFDTKNLQSEKSILDCMLGDVASINRDLSREDAHKLDQFTTSVRDIEKRIDRVGAPPASRWRPTLDKPDMLRPVHNIEQTARLSLGVRHKLMMRVLALALQMDKTRVATYILARDQSSENYEFLPGVSSTALHGLAHHASVPDLVRQFQLTNQYHVSLFATFLEHLKSVDEGDSTLLDNSMILFGSNVRDDHNDQNVPLVLAGGGGGTLKPGGYLSFEKTEDRRLCNLHLAMLQRMDVTVDGKPIAKFGTSIKPLEGI
jgi:hypothetical protein